MPTLNFVLRVCRLYHSILHASILKVKRLPHSNLQELFWYFGIYYVDTFAEGIQPRSVRSSKFPQSRGISAHLLMLISTICSEIPKNAARLPTNSFFRLEAVKFPRGFAHLANIQKHCFNFPCLPLQHSLILILHASKICNCIFLTKATFLLDMSTIHISIQRNSPGKT